MNSEILAHLQASAAVLFASVLLIVSLFLIARVARVRQPMALVLALLPMAIALAADGALIQVLGFR